MNNEQFRRLLQGNAPSSANTNTQHQRDGTKTGNATPGPGGMALGSRMRSSIPMTPRSVTGVNFARQLADHRREQQQQPSTKRFRSSAAPKGTKLPSGYHDRAQQRQSQNTAHDDGAGGKGQDLEKRLTALEELVKKGEMEQGTFEKLRAEIGVGGDVGSTHMVKGLDWELLRRVKAGEDIETRPEREGRGAADGSGGEAGEGEEGQEEEVDLDAEFERVTEQKGSEEVGPAAPKEKKEKKGSMAPPPVPAKKSRDEILRELKASRTATAAQPPPPPPESTLGSKFKKLGDSKPEKKRFVEADENGRRREVLVITDAQGNTKRKTRWLDKPGEAKGLLMPDKGAKPLGMDVPAEIAAKQATAAAAPEEDEDIFEGVGADYNPLGDIGDDGNDDSDEEEGEKGQVVEKPTPASTQPSTTTEQPTKPRNYFATSTRDEPTEDEDTRTNPLTRDPNLLAAFKRAAALRQASPSADPEAPGKDDSRSERFLEEVRRREAQDAMDMDMGFGGSRIDDEEEEEPVVLEGDGGGSRGGQKRKRGPKKRKGDKESAADVMKVLEGRKK